MKPATAPRVADFLRDQDDATRAKYAAELANADSEEWRKSLDFWYAESLVYFGELERKVETLYQGPHVVGSRHWFRKVEKTTHTVEYSGGHVNQRELFA